MDYGLNPTTVNSYISYLKDREADANMICASETSRKLFSPNETCLDKRAVVKLEHILRDAEKPSAPSDTMIVSEKTLEALARVADSHSRYALVQIGAATALASLPDNPEAAQVLATKTQDYTADTSILRSIRYIQQQAAAGTNDPNTITINAPKR